MTGTAAPGNDRARTALAGIAGATGAAAAYSLDIVRRDGTDGIHRAIHPLDHCSLRGSLPAAMIGAALAAYGAWQLTPHLSPDVQAGAMFGAISLGGAGLVVGSLRGLSAGYDFTRSLRLYRDTDLLRKAWGQEFLGYALPYFAGATAVGGLAGAGAGARGMLSEPTSAGTRAPSRPRAG